MEAQLAPMPALTPPGKGKLWVPDHVGENYLSLLRRLHEFLDPKTYLEIGCGAGLSLALANCASLGIDPHPRITAENVWGTKPLCALYRMTSDAYFATHDPKAILGGPVELAFLDGMHLCEYLLRDFVNTEGHCFRNSVIVLHDCLPVETPMAEREHQREPIREHHKHSWTGDVWRTALLLRRRRPDLEITAYASPPTGLVCVTNLNPVSRVLSEDYPGCVRQMMGEALEDLGIHSLYHELAVEPTTVLQTREQVATRFWL